MKVVDMSACSIVTTHILGMCPSAKGCVKVLYELRLQIGHESGLRPLPLSSMLHLVNGHS